MLVAQPSLRRATIFSLYEKVTYFPWFLWLLAPQKIVLPKVIQEILERSTKVVQVHFFFHLRSVGGGSSNYWWAATPVPLNRQTVQLLLLWSDRIVCSNKKCKDKPRIKKEPLNWPFNWVKPTGTLCSFFFLGIFPHIQYADCSAKKKSIIFRKKTLNAAFVALVLVVTCMSVNSSSLTWWPLSSVNRPLVVSTADDGWFQLTGQSPR